jgi:4-oxalocrotonate tautomerase family enzyme
MPVVKIDMWSGRDKETKRKLIQEVSKTVANTLGITVGRVEVN